MKFLNVGNEGPKEDIDPDQVIDVARGAVVFDPWPFDDRTVHVGAYASMSESKIHVDGGYLDSETWNTLAYTFSGKPVAMKQEHFETLMKDQS